MDLAKEQIEKLKDLMRNSARKGNLANSGIVLENGKNIASSESLVVTNNDATSHSERMLVEKVCKMKKANYTPGLKMVTVCEPCLMCLSACVWAGYSEVAYIIQAEKYLSKIPWMSETRGFNKQSLTKYFSEPIKLTRLTQYEFEFSKVFEQEMKNLLQKK